MMSNAICSPRAKARGRARSPRCCRGCSTRRARSVIENCVHNAHNHRYVSLNRTLSHSATVCSRPTRRLAAHRSVSGPPGVHGNTPIDHSSAISASFGIRHSALIRGLALTSRSGRSALVDAAFDDSDPASGRQSSDALITQVRLMTRARIRGRSRQTPGSVAPFVTMD